MTPLRQQVIEDMMVRNLAPTTQAGVAFILDIRSGGTDSLTQGAEYQLHCGSPSVT